MKLGRYFSIIITFLLVVSLTIIVPLFAHSQTPNLCQQNGVVCLDNQELFTISDNSEPSKNARRAEIITEKLQYIADNYSISIDSIKVEEGYGTNNIMVEEAIFVTVTDADGKAAGLNRKSLAERWLLKIKVSIGKHRKNPYIPSIKDNIAIFWINYIEPYYLIIIVTPIVVGLLYVLLTGIYFYASKCGKCEQFYYAVNKRFNSLKNVCRKLQQEQWANHLYQSLSQIFKLTKNVKEFIVVWFGIGIEIILFLLILLLICRLIFVIYYNNFDLKSDDLEELRKYVATLLNIIGLLLLFGVVSVLLHWLSSSRGGTVVLPFDDTTGSPSQEKNNNSRQTSNQGKAIADSLVEELHRISDIHMILSQTIKTGEEKIELQRLGKFNFPHLTPIQENIESNLTDVATFEVGKTRFSVGSIILILNRLWPFGGVNRVISGSLQTYDYKTRLVVRLEFQNQVKAWEVTWENHDKEPMTEKIKDLAYKVAMYLAPDITAQTWEGFKFFTEAISSYYQYQQTGDREHLDHAKKNCGNAYKAERKYEKLDDLFYKIGMAYYERKLYWNAEKAFQSSLEINPKSEYSHTGLGNVYYAQENLEYAITEYERAIRLNEDFPYAYNGLGNVYFQQGDFENAREQYEYACQKNDNYWHDHFWKPYHNLGLIYLYKHEYYLTDSTDYTEAEVQFKNAIKVNKQLKDSQELHPVHSGLALAYLFQAIATEEPLHYVQLKEDLLYLSILLENKNIPVLKQKEMQEKTKEYKIKLENIKIIIDSQSYNRYQKLFDNSYRDYLQNIQEKLDQAITEIYKAADIALDKEAYIYWNLGLIKLAQIKIAKVNIKVDEVYDAWQKASKIASNKSNDLCITIYDYAIDALKNTNYRHLDELLKTINHPQHCQKKGCLKVILKDVKIISTCLDEQNQPINTLIQKLEEIIKKIKD
jgi:tetratricopeptide (TPR) repeat protein